MTMSFQDAVGKWGAKALVRIDKIRRASILELFSLVIDGTPVDKGLLRGNWQVSLNSPIKTTTDRLDPGGNAAKAEALATLGSLVDIVFMTNNLPYAERIEYESYSHQAPAGMVRVNKAKWSRIVAAKAKAIKE